jgi:hypothetical protein
LIRLGKPENEKLLNYTEKHSALESHAHRELVSRLSTMKLAYHKLQQWMSARDIAVKVGEQEIAECLMIASHYLAEEGGDEADEDDDDDDDDDESQVNESNYFFLQKLLTKSIESLEVISIVPNLCHRMEHWKIGDGQRDLTLLGQWLRGNNPPPRCQYSFIKKGTEQQCLESTPADGLSYCRKFHACAFPNCSLLRSSLSHNFCEEHRCRATHLESEILCEEAHIPESTFCPSHCCVVCLVKEREVGEVCKAHCCKRDDQCKNSCVGNFNFCVTHCCPNCIRDRMVSKSSGSDKLSQYCKDFHRCRFPSCSSEIQLFSGFCARHTCCFCDQRVLYEDILLCLNHKCQFNLEDCSSPIARDVNGKLSKFCDLHTCQTCAKNGNELNRYVSLPGYTCSEHISMRDDDGCDVLCEASLGDGEGSLLQLDEFCCGLTTKGKPCRSKRTPDCKDPRYYCKDHLQQRSPPCTISRTTRKTTGHLFRLDFYYHRPWQSTCTGFAQVEKCSVLDCQRHEIRSLNPSDFRQSENYVCNFHTRLSRHHADPLVPQVSRPTNVTPPPPLVTMRPVEAHIGLSFKREINEVSLDDIDVVDEEGFNANNIDEMEMTGMDDIDIFMDEEIPENRKHFEDIYQEEEEGNGHDSPGDDASGFVFEEDIDEIDFRESLAILQLCQTWDWEMSHTLRQSAVFQMMTTVCRILKHFLRYAEAYVDEARQLKAQASAHILKQASVIGGTVVGGAKRLAALRAAEPFAIIVEEACEVMEPTLVAVLAVESVKKLELIGDHRQLPAFVNQCWYNLECSIPSIKTSLFERIIMSGDSHGRGGELIQRRDICTILDVQRRMRTCISNMTREEYCDLVSIKDHPATLRQLIGDKSSVVPPMRKFWEYSGRSIPGIQSCLYFWNLENNSESRPIAGLSACNENEALSIVELVKYLTLCGIPDESMTIITPYDGQKRLIVQLLKKHNCLPVDQFHEKEKEKLIRVSTVDRFQGDENDIVILSLVRTRPGNRFVGLLNRFIVATSRARLGFYIVGSVNAVVSNNQGPSHWKRFIGQLSGPDTSSCDSYQSTRVGPTLPICCPLHHQSKSNIPSLPRSRIFPTADRWNNFCQEICTIELSCGHPCDLRCHAPHYKKHNSLCAYVIPRPCYRHQMIPLLCHMISRLPGESIQGAMKRWVCKCPVSLELGCGHEVLMTCNQESNVRAGFSSPPLCEVMIDEYIHPRCGHRFNDLPCHLFQKYLTTPPLCQLKIMVTRKCGHRKEIECCRSELISQDAIPCKEVLRIQRPRCQHHCNLHCDDHQQLTKSWSESYGTARLSDGTTVVEERTLYGPSESSILPNLPVCLVSVNYRKQCGHMLTLQCDEAFKLSIRGTNCGTLVSFRPPCGHNVIKVPCSDVTTWRQTPELAPKCSIEVTCRSPLCNHYLRTTCSLSSALATWRPWSSEPEFVQATSNAKSILYYPPPFPFFSPQGGGSIPRCTTETNIRFRACGHHRTAPCQQVYDPRTKLVCKTIIEIICEKCHLPRTVSCQETQQHTPRELVKGCNNVSERLCFICRVNLVPSVPCNQVEVNCHRVVECTLKCGHSLRWKCGKAEDPRSSYDPNRSNSSLCPVCCIQKWAIDRELMCDETNLLTICRKMLNEVPSLGQRVSVLEEEVLLDLGELMKHQDTRDRIISHLQDTIRDGRSKIIFPPSRCSSPLSDIGPCIEEYVRLNYRLVYFHLGKDMSHPIVLTGPSGYGVGTIVEVLQHHTLASLVSPKTGQIKLSLGLGFQASALTNPPLFFSDSQQQDYQRRGHDCVEVISGDTSTMIYWKPYAIIPLLTVQLRLSADCVSCSRSRTRSFEFGLSCSKSRHFICYGCFRQYLNDQALVTVDGDILCTFCETETPSPGADPGASGGDSRSCVPWAGADEFLPHDVLKSLREIKAQCELKKSWLYPVSKCQIC